jgi:hypothetical protein
MLARAEGAAKCSPNIIRVLAIHEACPIQVKKRGHHGLCLKPSDCIARSPFRRIADEDQLKGTRPIPFGTPFALAVLMRRLVAAHQRFPLRVLEGHDTGTQLVCGGRVVVL